MRGILLRTLIIVLGLAIASAIVPGVDIFGTGSLILAAFLLAIVNAVVRPIAFVLTLPLTIVTLGLFLFVLNAAMFGLVAAMLDNFTVAGFWSAVFGSIITNDVKLNKDIIFGCIDTCKNACKRSVAIHE